MANFIRDNPIKTLLAVAHVRKKTRGKASLENTHPFKRVLWGRHWVFAHNGTLPHVRRHKLRVEEPLGETDSEHAFCWMLERIRDAFPGGYPKDQRRLWRLVAELGGQLGAEGKFNFLLADGRHLYARCGTKLCYIIRKSPFGRRHAVRRRDGHRFFRGDHREGSGRGRLDRAAHPRRDLAARDAGIALGVQPRGAARDAAQRDSRSRSGAAAARCRNRWSPPRPSAA